MSEQEISVCAAEGQAISRPNGFGINGTIVYQKSNYYGLYTIGGTPLRQAQLPLDATQQASVYGFSPDGNRLAYAPEISRPEDGIVFGTPVLILLSATGERVKQNLDVSGLEEKLHDRCCPDHKFFDSIGEWINNELLTVYLGATATMEGGMTSTLPVVFDPMTGSWQDQWLDNLPDLDAVSLGYTGINHIQFSPDLSRVLYHAKGGGVILRDLVQELEVWSDRKFPVYYGDEMDWSPDSAVVAVVNMRVPEDRRLLLISRDGEVREIVNAVFPQPKFFVSTLRWSPDSRYLTFVDSYDEVNLYLYDAQANRYLYRCPLPSMDYPKVIWSPDGEWIAFGERLEGSMYILRVQTGEVIKLLENASPVGWSDQFPVVWP